MTSYQNVNVVFPYILSNDLVHSYQNHSLISIVRETKYHQADPWTWASAHSWLSCLHSGAPKGVSLNAPPSRRQLDDVGVEVQNNELRQSQIPQAGRSGQVKKCSGEWFGLGVK